MKQVQLVSLTVLAVVLACSSSLFASNHLKTDKKAPPATKSDKTLGTAPAPAPPVKVEVTTFSIYPGTPRPGEIATLKATIRNSGEGRVKVPWAFRNATHNRTLRQGEDTLEPGASLNLEHPWIADPGPNLIQIYVDPTGKVLKNTVPIDSQIVKLEVNVPHLVKVRISDLSVAPTPMPGPGSRVLVTATIKNEGSLPSQVKWKIFAAVRTPGSGGSAALLGSGVATLAPGALGPLVGGWLVASGGHRFVAHIDVAGNTAAQMRTMEVDVTPVLEVRTFDFKKAKASELLGPVQVLSRTGTGCTYDETYSAASLVDSLTCPAGATMSIRRPHLVNFVLKNHWRIKTVTPTPGTGGGSFRADTMPRVGSDDGTFLFTLTAAAGTTASVTITATIEGPNDTDPYE